MNINNHTLEIIVNGVPIDLYEDGVNLRINKIVQDPTKIQTTQAEYSFTFNLPITPTNSKAFNYANISSKSNKFSGRFNCEVYADNISIFNGTIKVTEVSENSFKCNLFKSKINTIESIFGDSKMNEINWKVPFKGTSTINQINADESTKYYFPLVAYSLFNKLPDIQTQSGNRRYTDKYLIDNTNRFYFNSFVPSLNLVELLKRCCELKGYQLQGDIISDPILNDIFLSNYIGDGQDPLYNYGDTDMGEVDLSVSWKNYNGTLYDTTNMIEYPLGFVPPTRVWPASYDNYNTAFVWNTLQSAYSTVTVNKNNSKMYVNGGIQIPADGWYEITLDANIGIPTTQGDITAEQCIYYVPGGSAVVNGQEITWEENRKFGNLIMNSSLTTVEGKHSSFFDNFPVEVQICKYDADDGEASNINHNIIFFGQYPNETDDILSLNQDGSIRFGRYSNAIAPINGLPIIDANSSAVAIDPYNNPDFICGLSQSTYGRNYAYIKDGYSWHSDYQDTSNNSLYNMNGYYFVYTDLSASNIFQSQSGYTQTDVNQNSLIGTTTRYAPEPLGRRTKGQLQMIVRLNKNDMLVPFAQTRGYYISTGSSESSVSTSNVYYQADADIRIKVRAVAPQITSGKKLSYNMNSLFDKDLNLGNFNNNQQKISDFFNDVQKAFNLSFQQDGNVIVLNKNKLDKRLTAPVDIDDKVNTSDAEFIAIDFPRSIEVKYKIDTEEEGFYRSVEDNTTEEQMQSNNWKDYGDYGYSKVNVSQADDATDLNQSLNFSYNWYQDFYVTQQGQSATVSLPIIGKTEWWIEGFKYEEMAKYDGRGMTQRMWFRGSQTGINVLTNGGEQVDITTCTNYKMYGNNVVYLNYKNGVNTLLGKYFNIYVNSASDQVDIEVYLTPMEYKLISAGSSVHFDDNIYKVIEINGYDPSGENPTKLSLISV